MPNNIVNQITFGSDEAALAAFQRMLEDMRVEGEPLGSFDFNKLIPMPEQLNIESGSRTYQGLKLYEQFVRDRDRDDPPKDFVEKWKRISKQDPETWELGKRAYHNIKEYGSPTWYEWCNKNWDTKWNAYGFQPMREGMDTLEFQTAWSPVPQLISLLSEKYPDQKVTYRWADEDLGYNVGECAFQAGKKIDEHIPPAGSREAYEMASEIQNLDLASCDLYLTADETTYEYREAPREKGNAARSWEKER